MKRLDEWLNEVHSGNVAGMEVQKFGHRKSVDVTAIFAEGGKSILQLTPRKGSSLYLRLTTEQIDEVEEKFSEWLPGRNKPVEDIYPTNARYVMPKF